MRPFSAVRKQEFIDWLKSQPEDTVFCEGSRTDSCPLAKFVNANEDISVPFIATSNLRKQIFPDSNNPHWANAFMQRFDNDVRTKAGCVSKISTVPLALEIAEQD